MTARSSKAVVLPAPQTAVEVRPVDIPDPGPRQVLVRMEACGVCHSDVFVSGLPKLPQTPLTLGHEGIGRIEALGSGVQGFTTGDRVGITFLGTTCGECEFCRTGRERFCPKQKNTGYTLDGALSGYALADYAQLVPVPGGVEPSAAAPLCCAGWTAYGALREAALPAGATVGIFGYGGLGQLALQYALTQDLKVAVADVSPAKAERAQASGAVLATAAPDSGRAFSKQLGGVDAAIVFTNSIPAMEQAVKSVKRMGTVVLVGLTTASLPIPVTEAVLKGIHLVGSYLGTRHDLETVFRLGAERGILPKIETFEIDAAPQILDQLEKGEVPGRAVVAF